MFSRTVWTDTPVCISVKLLTQRILKAQKKIENSKYFIELFSLFVRDIFLLLEVYLS